MRKRKLIGKAFGVRPCYRTSRWLLAIFAASALGAAPAAAQEDTPVRELEVRRGVAFPIAVGFGVGWVASELAKDELAPDPCRWCDSVPAVDRRVREAWKWENTHAAATASDVLDFAVVPALVLGGDALLASQHGALSGWDEDAIVILEAAMIASAVNQVVKFSVGRERPFVHHLESDEEKAKTEHPADNNVSFYSGHTSLAFALAGAGGAVAEMRGYDNGWVVWPVAGAMAATVGYLRIGADKHWFTDVATGAVVGGTIGVGVPYLLHRPREKGVRSDALQSGRAALGPGPTVMFVFAF